MSAMLPMPMFALPEPQTAPARSVFARALYAHQAGFHQLGQLEGVVVDASRRLAACLAAGGKVLLCGMEGTTSLGLNLVMLLAGRAGQARPPLAALALSAELAQGRGGLEEGFARQVLALGRPGDALVVISGGEDWTPLKRAADQASEMGLLTVGLLVPASAGLAESCHVAVTVSASSELRQQEAQQFICHALWELIEAEQQ
jgi:D-sedoheptulose 7-phosphate isomerase